MIKKCSFCCEYKSLAEYYYSKQNRNYFAECKSCFRSRATLDYHERKALGKYRPKLIADRTMRD